MSPLGGFWLRVLVWLPLSFAAWYYFAILFTEPLAAIVDLVMVWSLPSSISRVVQYGTDLVVETHVAVHESGTGAGRSGNLLFELNPLTYGYCVPLYTALVLATPGSEGVKWARWFVGMLLLIPIQVWGISTSIIKTLAFDLGPEARAQLGFAPWGYNLIALAYQFGYLILPPVAPIAIWLGQFRDFLGTLNARKDPQPKPADR